MKLRYLLDFALVATACVALTVSVYSQSQAPTAYSLGSRCTSEQGSPCDGTVMNARSEASVHSFVRRSATSPVNRVPSIRACPDGGNNWQLHWLESIAALRRVHLGGSMVAVNCRPAGMNPAETQRVRSSTYYSADKRNGHRHCVEARKLSIGVNAESATSVHDIVRRVFVLGFAVDHVSGLDSCNS